MILILLIIFLIQRVKTSYILHNKIVLFYFIGVLALIVNVHWTYLISGSYFAGSDASFFYDELLLFAQNKFEELSSLDSRYIGYIIYQFLVSYPFIYNEFLASVLIKLSSWTLFIISFSSVAKNLFIANKSNIVSDKFVFSTFFIIGLWLCMYNFRDILILVCLLLSSSVYFSSGKYKIFKYLLVFFVLFYFRFFYVAIILLSYLLSRLLFSLIKNRVLGLHKFNVLLIILFLFIVMVLGLDLLDAIHNFVILNLLDSETSVTMKGQSFFLTIMSSFFAGNTLWFFLEYFVLGQTRAFVITPLAAICQGVIYFYSYYYFLQLFVFVFYSNKVNQVMLRSDKKILYVNIVTFFILFIVIIYSLYMEGVQERIRIVMLCLLAIVNSILKKDVALMKKISNKLKIFSIVMVVVVFFIYFIVKL